MNHSLSTSLLAIALLSSMPPGCQGPDGPGRSADTPDARPARGEPPDWLSGPSARYPATTHLSAVGSGSNRSLAEENARAELARIFRSEIVSRTRTYEKYLQTSSGKKTQVQEEINQENLTTISTRKVIEGSEIAEVFRQKQPEMYYALAILHRAKTSRILEDRLEKLNAEIGSLLQEADTAGNKLDRLRNLHRSVPKFALRDAYDTELRIVSGTGQGHTSPFHFEEVQAKLDQILAAELSIAVRVTGHAADELRSGILQQLGNKNLRVQPDAAGQAYDLLLEVTSAFKSVPRNGEFIDSRWEVHGRLLNREQKELNTLVREGGGGYLNRSLAEEMALKEIRDQVPEALGNLVGDYLFGL